MWATSARPAAGRDDADEDEDDDDVDVDVLPSSAAVAPASLA